MERSSLTHRELTHLYMYTTQLDSIELFVPKIRCREREIKTIKFEKHTKRQQIEHQAIVEMVLFVQYLDWTQ